MRTEHHIENPDVILIGSGVMSANLGALLKCLDPAMRIQVYEVTEGFSQESSHGWNNAGTGHAGICELSYTPFRHPDGSVDVDKAIGVFEEFERSKLFWAYAVEKGMIDNPREFINQVPHISFVYGQEQVDFLKDRHASLSAHHFFRDMAYSTDRDTIRDWAPLLIEERGGEPVAATKMDTGTDVNFGSVARKFLGWLSRQEGCGLADQHRVIDLEEAVDGWIVTVEDLKSGRRFKNRAGFVFVGAGGGSLPLLQKAGIPESRGLGGFPIGGQWLVCDNPAVVQKHQAKVYGQAQAEAPTMAVPHLDTRVLDGKKTLLFGPFASWTTKFLHKKGSFLDLPLSIRPHNLLTLTKVGLKNLDLVKYLVQQGTQSMADRMKVLYSFYPGAQSKDWKLIDAGIRVQAIKKTDGEAGIVHYGTEVITNDEKSISALLGASPGASVCVSIVLEVIENCFPQLLQSDAGKARIREMVPCYGDNAKDPAYAERFHEMDLKARRILELV